MRFTRVSVQYAISIFLFCLEVTRLRTVEYLKSQRMCLRNKFTAKALDVLMQ
jgi:hypothetical protein